MATFTDAQRHELFDNFKRNLTERRATEPAQERTVEQHEAAPVAQAQQAERAQQEPSPTREPTREPTPLEQAQAARAPSLGAQRPPMPQREPEQAHEAHQGPSKMPPLQAEREASVEHLRGAKLMDLPIPGHARERSPTEDFLLDSQRRATVKMAPTLGQQTQATGLAPKAPEVEQQGQEQGQEGKGQGGRERPNDPSYYTQFSQSVALPKRDEQSMEKQAARRAVDRQRSRGMGGMGL
jgi:hypothetical protein